MYVLCIYKQANNNLVYNLLTMSRDSNGKKIWTPKELSKVPIGELKSIRVSIKRSNIATTGPSTDLIRGIDDPKVISQLVHCKRGDLRRPIFDRDDVVVNSEEQIGSVDSRLESPRSRNLSRSASRSSRSPECNRRDDRSKKKGEEKRTHPFAG
ncbi:unnamed protein product [Callosobruchus maculatus]|uniref:Uncharacterized protein n=1 Tax=Callosobruchus maculatus TaxID=64391 RepID=A0A653BWY3_CALMS|nr:unnamed protein product [Callosobruchus maculatus]